MQTQQDTGLVVNKEFLMSLTPRRRGIALLHLGYKFSYDDLAKAFGIEKSTAKSHVYKIFEAYVSFYTERKQK